MQPGHIEWTWSTNLKTAKDGRVPNTTNNNYQSSIWPAGNHRLIIQRQRQTINKQPMGCQAQLACKCLFTPTMVAFWMFSSELGQTGLVFGVLSVFISRSVQDCKSLWTLCHPGSPKSWFLHVNSCKLEKQVEPETTVSADAPISANLMT